VRRKFDAARASSPGAAQIVRQGLKLIRHLYHLDNQGQDKPPDERKRYRQAVVSPQLDKIRRWIDDSQGRALGYGGLLATAFTYIHNQWLKLIVFLDDGRLQLDNNNAERHIRPFATGRKVWLFARSQAGAKATAIWYSVAETARATGLDPYWCLRKILQVMPLYLRDKRTLNDLLPWNVNRDDLKALSGRG
jgi:transposase